jgi:pimeloyl-ACP methyl ester carboxylesterase
MLLDMLRGGRARALVVTVLAAAALLTGVAPATASTLQATGPDARLRFTPCPIHLPTPRHVDCGKLRVPEDRSDPGSPTIRVAFAIVRAPAPVRPDPVVFFMGGPSYPAIDAFSLFVYFDHTAYTAHRDLILVDFRGVRSSRPFLNCPVYDKVEAATWPEGPNQAQKDRADLACARRTRMLGDPRRYGSVDTALDIRDLRRALGISQWNVMAFSAGGEPALQYLRIDPKGIRAAILDAPVTNLSRPGVTPWWWVEIPNRLLNLTLGGCAAQPSCAKAFPNLKARFWHLVEQLDRHPHHVDIRVAGGGSLGLNVSGYFFQQDVAGLLGDPFAQPFAPAIIDDLIRNGIDPLYDFTIDPPFPSADVIPDGRTRAYRCREFFAFQTRDTIQVAMDRFPRWSRVARAGFADDHHICHLFDVGRASAVRNPVSSDAPTLVFEGEWDPAVPNPPIEAAARHFRNGTLVQVPGIGHGALASWVGWQDCPRSVATAFLNHPTAPVDTTCVDHMPHVVFETSLPSGLSPGSALRSAVDRCAVSASSPARCSFWRRR